MKNIELRARRNLLAFAGTVLGGQLLPVNSSFSQEKQMRFIVPTPPGGVADNVARLYAAGLSEVLGETVIVENHPGAAAIAATTAVYRAPADGRTLTFALMAHLLNDIIKRNSPYDFERDFAPISLLVKLPNVISVLPSHPAKSLTELLEMARKAPNSISFASAGTGHSSHLAGELLASMSQTNMTHIPYRGAAAAMTDFLGGHVSVLFDTVLTSAPHIASKSIRPLAVTSSARNSALPSVPTVAECGFPGYDADAWLGVMIRADAPKKKTALLSKATVAILESPKLQQKLNELGATVIGSDSRDFAIFLSTERKKWKEIVEKNKIELG